jgi:hypothetical protein
VLWCVPTVYEDSTKIQPQHCQQCKEPCCTHFCTSPFDSTNKPNLSRQKQSREMRQTYLLFPSPAFGARGRQAIGATLLRPRGPLHLHAVGHAWNLPSKKEEGKKSRGLWREKKYAHHTHTCGCCRVLRRSSSFSQHV